MQEERKRIGLNQDDFAQKVSIAKRTLAGYEAGTSDVGAAVMAKASELGIDVLYVVTGEHTPARADGLSQEESLVLEQFRSLPEQDKAAVSRLTAALAATTK